MWHALKKSETLMHRREDHHNFVAKNSNDAMLCLKILRNERMVP